MSTSPLARARDTDRHRGLLNSLQLQTPVEILSGALIPSAGLFIGLAEELLHRKPGGLVPYHNKVPGLHEANRSGVVGGGEESGENLVRNPGRKEVPAHIPSLEDDAVDCSSFLLRKPSVGPNRRLLACLHGFTRGLTGHHSRS